MPARLIDIPDGLLGRDPAHVATYVALACFAREGEDSPTLMQLTQRLGVTSPSTVVRRLAAMESEGLIRREPHTGARRVRYRLALS